VELVAKGNHKTTQGLASKFKANMQNNRSFFTWEHLVVFINRPVCHSTLFNPQVRYSPIQAVTFGEPCKWKQAAISG
jgi:hypothetical protein